MDDSQIRNALIKSAIDFLTGFDTMKTRFGEISDLPTVSEDAIAWENRNFDKSNKPLWAAVYYMPNQPFSRAIGKHAYDETNGILQIDLNIPPDTGEGVLNEWLRKARLFYYHGRYLDHESQNVLVLSSGMSQGSHQENNYRKSITIQFKARTLKNNQI